MAKKMLLEKTYMYLYSYPNEENRMSSTKIYTGIRPKASMLIPLPEKMEASSLLKYLPNRENENISFFIISKVLLSWYVSNNKIRILPP